jgi:hypothetical protein
VEDGFVAYAQARYTHLVRSASLMLGRDRDGAQDLEFTDIADLLQISAVTARTQCLRARGALRSALEDQHEVHP